MPSYVEHERGILKPELKNAIFTQYSNKCYVCGYSVKAALRSHHIIPREYGGKNNIDNFVLLCSNCHTLTHFYSSTRYQNKEIKSYLKPQLQDEAINRLKELILKVHSARKRISENGNRWTDRTLYTIGECMEIIAKRNKFTDEQRNQLSQVFDKVMKEIPSEILNDCSFRLLKDGKYLSINHKNHLLFRSPAYGDFAEKPQFDCYLTFPKDKVPENLKPVEDREAFFFSFFDCINVGLSFAETLKFNEAEWRLFQDACLMAQNARNTREWVSNVGITSK